MAATEIGKPFVGFDDQLLQNIFLINSMPASIFRDGTVAGAVRQPVGDPLAQYITLGSGGHLGQQTGAVRQPGQPKDMKKVNCSTSAAVRHELYKTELCRTFSNIGRCSYGKNCQYAHGDHELRQVQRHPKFKTIPCRSFHTLGECKYGNRCRFIHDEQPPAAAVAADPFPDVGVLGENLPYIPGLEPYFPCVSTRTTPLNGRPSPPATFDTGTGTSGFNAFLAHQSLPFMAIGGAGLGDSMSALPDGIKLVRHESVPRDFHPGSVRTQPPPTVQRSQSAQEPRAGNSPFAQDPVIDFKPKAQPDWDPTPGRASRAGSSYF